MPQPIDPGGVGEALLTLQEAADHLKVHYMTAYRWVRRGQLPAFKAGGRLRVRTTDLERFVQRRSVDVALPSGGQARTDWKRHVSRFHRLITEGKGSEAGALVRKVVADGAAAGDVYVQLVTPALYRVGDDWVAGRIDVAEEHRATEIAATIVARLGESFRRRGPRRGTAVTLSPAGERHGLGGAMVADFLRAGGYHTHHLGTDVPTESIGSFVDSVQPDVVCLSVTRGDLDRQVLDGLVAGVHERCPGAIVVLGGQGVDEHAADRSGAVHVADLAMLTRRLASARRSATV